MRRVGAVLTSVAPVALRRRRAGQAGGAARPQPRPAPRPSQGSAKPKKAEPRRRKGEKKDSRQAKAATKRREAAASPRRSRDSYNAIPLAERIAIQSDLIWTGDYNGVRQRRVRRSLDRRRQGVPEAQRRQGNRRAQSAGARRARRRREAEAGRGRLAHRRRRCDRRARRRAGQADAEQRTSAAASRWSSQRSEYSAETFRIAQTGTTLAAIFERMKKEPAGRKTEYSVLRDDFFVISGLQNLKKFYVRAQLRGDEVRGITILYDQAMAGIMEPVVVAMSSAYAAFPSGRRRRAAAAPQGRICERHRGRRRADRHQPRGARRLLRGDGRRHRRRGSCRRRQGERARAVARARRGSQAGGARRARPQKART